MALEKQYKPRIAGVPVKRASGQIKYVLVYDIHGNEYRVKPVNAREYIATGRYFDSVPGDVAAKEKPEKTPAKAKEKPEKEKPNEG